MPHFILPLVMFLGLNSSAASLDGCSQYLNPALQVKQSESLIEALVEGLMLSAESTTGLTSDQLVLFLDQFSSSHETTLTHLIQTDLGYVGTSFQSMQRRLNFFSDRLTVASIRPSQVSRSSLAHYTIALGEIIVADYVKQQLRLYRKGLWSPLEFSQSVASFAEKTEYIVYEIVGHLDPSVVGIERRQWLKTLSFPVLFAVGFINPQFRVYRPQMDKWFQHYFAESSPNRFLRLKTLANWGVSRTFYVLRVMMLVASTLHASQLYQEYRDFWSLNFSFSNVVRAVNDANLDPFTSLQLAAESYRSDLKFYIEELEKAKTAGLPTAELERDVVATQKTIQQFEIDIAEFHLRRASRPLP